MNSYSIFNIHIQFVSLSKRFSVSPARELPTHVFHTPLARASLFAGYVYLRLHVAIKHSVKSTHELSVLSSSSWQGVVKELNIYPIHSVSVALVSVYATSSQSDHLIEAKTIKITRWNLRKDDRDLLIPVSLTMIKENDFQDFCNTYVEGDHLIQGSLIYDWGRFSGSRKNTSERELLHWLTCRIVRHMCA